jgi:hypothetical protein
MTGIPFFFLGNTEVLTQGFMFFKQSLCHLNPSVMLQPLCQLMTGTLNESEEHNMVQSRGKSWNCKLLCKHFGYNPKADIMASEVKGFSKMFDAIIFI